MKYENEKKEIAKINNYAESDMIKLNVGGTHMLASSRRVLCQVKGSSLEKMFSGMHKLQMIDDHVFLDRDGKTFEIMLNYLRYDRKLWPDFRSEGEQKLLQQELLFWGIRDDTQSELAIRKKFSN